METYINMIADNANLVMIALGLLFVLLAFLGGLIKGRKKSIYKLITWAIFWVAVYLVADVCIGALYDLEVEVIEGVGLDLASLGLDTTGAITVKDIVVNFVKGLLGMDASVVLDAATANVIVALSAVVVKIVYIIVMWIVGGIIYGLITGIIWLFIKGKKYTIVKDEQGKEKKVRKPKHALAGGIVGAVNGFLVFLLFVAMVLNPILTIVPSIEVSNPDATKNAETTEPVSGGLDAYLQDPTIQAILKFSEGYKGSYVSSIYNIKVGEVTLGEFIAGFVYSGSYGKGDEKVTVNIYNELKNISDIATTALPLINAFMAPSESETSNVLEKLAGVDLTVLARIIDKVGNSEFLQNVMPLVVNYAEANAETLKLDSTMIGLLKSINFKSDLSAIATTIEKLAILEGKLGIFANISDLSKLDFSDLTTEDIHAIFDALTDVGIFSNLGKLVSGFVYDESRDMTQEDMITLLIKGIQEQFSKEQLENSINWKDEFMVVSTILEEFVNSSVDSIADATNIPALINEANFGKLSDENDVGAIGRIINAIFASKFIGKVATSAISAILVPMIPAEYADLFDLDAIAEKGWNNELTDLLAIAKQAQAIGEPLANEDGSFNFLALTGIDLTVLLNSELITTALVNAVVQGAQGNGALAVVKDYLALPKTLADADDSANDGHNWKVTEIRKYVAIEDCTVSGTEYTKTQTISVAQYEALSGADKAHFKPITKVIGGELFKVINSLNALLEAVDITQFIGGSGFSIASLLDEELMNNLNKTNSKDPTKTNLECLFVSEVLSASISKLLVSFAGELITVPASACEVVTLHDDSSLNVITMEEFKNVIGALLVLKDDILATKYTNKDNAEDVITKEAYDALDEEAKANYTETLSFNVSLGLINCLSDVVDTASGKTKLDCLLESDILRATVSGFLGNVGEAIQVPDDAKDAEGYITKAEMKAVIEGIIALDIMDENGEMKALGLGLVSELTDAKIEKICASKILSATISKIICDMEGTIQIPADAKDAKGNLTEGELKALVSGIVALDIVDDNGQMKELGLGLVTSLTDAKIGKICASKILHATVSKVICDMEGTVQIPADAKDPNGNLTETELKALVSGIIALDIVDDNGQMKELGVGLINDLDDAKIEKLVASKILTATVSKIITDMSGTIVVPSSCLENGVIKADELSKTMKAIKALDIISGGNVEVSLDIVNSLCDVVDAGSGKTKLDYCLDSAILTATFKDKIMESADAASPTIYVPATVYVNNELTTAELEALVKGINNAGLNLNDMSSLSDPSSLLDDSKVAGKSKLDCCFESAILKTTIGKTVADLEMDIPDQAIESVTLHNNNNVDVVKEQDLRDLLSAIKTLKGSDAELDYSKIPERLLDSNTYDVATNQAAAGKSVIIRSIVSGSVFDGSAPTDCVMSGTNIMTEAEFNNLFKSLNALGITDVENMNIDEDTLSSVSDWNTVLASNFIWNKISVSLSENEMFTGITTETITYANNTTIKAHDDATGRLSKAEIQAIVSCLDKVDTISTETAEFAACSKGSVLMTAALGGMISDALDGKDGAEDMKARIDDVTANLANWYEANAVLGINASGELVNFFAAVDQLDTASSTSASAAERQAAFEAIDASYILRIALEDIIKDPLQPSYDYSASATAAARAASIAHFIELIAIE